MTTIFEYFDYRKMLKDLFDERKSENKYFSYRVLGELVGFSSAGFFTKILQGSVNISSKNALSFAKAFKLTKIETRYFELLVMFNQSKTHEERRYYFEQLISMRKTKVKELTSDQYDFFSEWYYVVIREILDYYPFSDDYKELGTLLRPRVEPAEVRNAIETLERLGLIRKHSDGNYKRTDEVISTGESWGSMAITNFQLRTAELARNAMQFVPKEDREISTLTLSISGPSFVEIREKIRNFRRELLEIAKKDPASDRIYHMNFHLFPVSKPYTRTDLPELTKKRMPKSKTKKGKVRSKA